MGASTKCTVSHEPSKVGVPGVPLTQGLVCGFGVVLRATRGGWALRHRIPRRKLHSRVPEGSVECTWLHFHILALQPKHRVTHILKIHPLQPSELYQDRGD